MEDWSTLLNFYDPLYPSSNTVKCLYSQVKRNAFGDARVKKPQKNVEFAGEATSDSISSLSSNDSTSSYHRKKSQRNVGCGRKILYCKRATSKPNRPERNPLHSSATQTDLTYDNDLKRFKDSSESSNDSMEPNDLSVKPHHAIKKRISFSSDSDDISRDNSVNDVSVQVQPVNKAAETSVSKWPIAEKKSSSKRNASVRCNIRESQHDKVTQSNSLPAPIVAAPPAPQSFWNCAGGGMRPHFLHCPHRNMPAAPSDLATDFNPMTHFQGYWAAAKNAKNCTCCRNANCSACHKGPPFANVANIANYTMPMASQSFTQTNPKTGNVGSKQAKCCNSKKNHRNKSSGNLGNQKKQQETSRSGNFEGYSASAENFYADAMNPGLSTRTRKSEQNFKRPSLATDVLYQNAGTNVDYQYEVCQNGFSEDPNRAAESFEDLRTITDRSETSDKTESKMVDFGNSTNSNNKVEVGRKDPQKKLEEPDSTVKCCHPWWRLG